jgi:hypothetical protein
MSNQSYKGRRVALGAMFVLLVLAGVTVSVRPHIKSGFFSREVQEQAGFPLYYPSRLPEGYEANQATISTVNKVVTYQIKHPANEPLLVSLQPRPNNFDVENFNKEVITEGISLTVSAGAATIGRLRGNQVASVLTDETWILISDPGSIPQQDLKFIVQHLKSS